MSKLEKAWISYDLGNSAFATTVLAAFFPLFFPEFWGKDLTSVQSAAYLLWTIALSNFLLFISAPYGRHLRSGWGPLLPKRLGWILMETPALYVIWIFYFLNGGFNNIVLVIFLCLWSIHYTNRSLIWPLLIDKNGSMPLVVALLAFIFNVFNASFHGYWFLLMDNYYDVSWLLSSNFLIGFCIFLFGMVVNIQSDKILLNISKECFLPR